MTFPGNIKGKVIFVRSLSFLAGIQSTQAMQHSFALSYPVRFQQQTDGHFNMREHIEHLTTVLLGNHYSFLLHQVDLEQLAEHQITVQLFTTVPLSLILTAQKKTSSQAAIKTSLFKLINILISFIFLPFNITRGNGTYQP